MSRRERCKTCGGKFNPRRDEQNSGLCERCRQGSAGAISVLPPAGSPLAQIVSSLATPNVPAGDLLMRAATQFQGEREQGVVSQVKIILERIASIERCQRKYEKQIILCRAQINAINSGRYFVNQQTLRIVFDEELLNIPWDNTASW